MKNKENSILKDTLILFAITLVAGLLLGFFNQLTKGPIEARRLAEKKETYQKVYAEAVNFGYTDQLDTYVIDSDKILASAETDLSNVTIDEILEAKDGDDQVIGYVVSATSSEGYGGDITMAVGIKLDGTVVSVDMITINETQGIGMKATEDSFIGQYGGKKVPAFDLVKGDASGDDQINAISGATITSKAVTKAINGAIWAVDQYINQP
ncbi:MAG TPA: RnfABCDGE type electron transport complex subunit G [Candidatus Merdenecus merdavium]|nr:RnfABCDGE type electron transport complex subunit G [Candidatus Merdenecus merdavium]